ncbi:DUF1857-domain-containing protein [Diplogelasinospora grovesii]|uniref:DUF1857-domain-containing protein n=1 Tax=Diplogelasinospora grovesii TaxID=303347 RepID=A0AAN6RYR7_9PEZI|nr:DUF1857-domain-containing protein [Diplogelasinospora grovesii]
MVVFNLGYTAPINRAGQEPTLTLAQVWAGLQRKVRHAQEFVPVIVECGVLSEEKDPSKDDVVVVTRTVRFKPGAGPGGQVKEVCKHYAPCRVDFYQQDGTTISNFVASGPSGEPEDLHMTYMFEWRHPDVEAGSEEAKKMEEAHRKTAKMAVESSIETIRRLVKEGKLE